jgi:dodecin
LLQPSDPRAKLCLRPYPQGGAKPGGNEIKLMAKIVKVIEILAESPKSWEEAAQNVVAEASKTLRNIRSVYIKEFSASVDAEKVTSYRVNAKVTFEMERGDQGKR